MSNSSSSSSTTSLHERELHPAPSACTNLTSSSSKENTTTYELGCNARPQDTQNSEISSQTTRVHANNRGDQGTAPRDQITFPQPLQTRSNHPYDNDNDRFVTQPHRESQALGRSLPLPSPGYDADYHPTTPTPPERLIRSVESSNTFSPSSSSSRKQHANFFESGTVDSPRTQRVQYGYGVEPSSTPAIGTDPLHALRVSMSHGSGFYMPEEEQARITGTTRRASSASAPFHNDDSYDDIDDDASRWYDPNDDSGHNASFSRFKRKERTRQGSKALDSDSEDDNENEEHQYAHSRLRNIHAPSPMNSVRHFQAFDIEQYDTPKTPSASDAVFQATAAPPGDEIVESSRLDNVFRTLEKLTDKVNILSFEQASQHREIERQNREIDRQSSEIDRLRQFTYLLSRSSGNPPSATHSSASTDVDSDSRRPSLPISLASGMSGAQSHGHDRSESYHYPPAMPQHSARQQAEDGSVPFPQAYPLHRSASQHIIGSTAKQEIESSHSRTNTMHHSFNGAHQAQQQLSAQQFQQQHQMHHASQRTTPVPTNTNANLPNVQTLPHASNHPSMPPRYASAAELYSSVRSRSSTSSGYTPSTSGSSAPGTHQTPFYALATASGVVLSDFDRGGQPNYRQLLQDQAIVDYRSIVRLILDRNDQQASIFLQQKLKSCMDPARRSLIIDSILPLAFDLITNRFGNFIVSRCLDLGDERQRTNIANTMQGHIPAMSCDTYGSHVVQKAIDLVEGFDLVVVAELGRNAKTLVNKSSGHVWSKLLSSSTPAANLYQSLKGINDWCQVAMDETGSLLCQSILENWPFEQKEKIVKALIRETVELCGSQWATFVVLHLIEHGRPEDREEIFDILLRSSIAIPQDQYGAKAIEKMVKVAGLTSAVTKTYVQQICDAVQGRPAVVTICQNANGSQIVTLLLTNAPVELKEMLIEAIRRHGVTLKGSKHGSRIWFVCERARAWKGH